MTLVEAGRLRLERPGRAAPPRLRRRRRRAAPAITVEQLLTHRAGLVPDDPMDLYTGTPAEIFARKYRQPLAHEPGARFVYSDVGFEVLGELVRVVAGETLDRYAARVGVRPARDGGHGVPAAAGRRRPRPDPARAHRADARRRERRHDARHGSRPARLRARRCRRPRGPLQHRGRRRALRGGDPLGRRRRALPGGRRVDDDAARLRRPRPARARLGRRHRLLQLPRRPLPARLVRPHGLDRHLAVDRPADRRLRRPPRRAACTPTAAAT